MGATVDGVVAQFAARGMPDITVHDLRGDGKKHVYGPKKKAWYRLFDWVAPSGVVWLSGVFGYKDEHWKVESEAGAAARMTAEEYAAARVVWAERQAEQERRQLAAYELAAQRSRAQFGRARKTGESGYVARKCIARVESARFMTDHGWQNWLIIPLINYQTGRWVGVQKIAPEKLPDGGDKRYTKGFEKIGAACRLGDEPIDGDLILVAEGYATAASVREGVDYEHPVYMALDSGNLPHLAKILRGRYPSSPLLFVADDDYLPTKGKVEPNLAGLKKARQAVESAGNAGLVLPVFTAARRAAADDESLPELTDFNDLHLAEGIDAVRAQLRAGIDALLSPPSAPAEPVVVDAQVAAPGGDDAPAVDGGAAAEPESAGVEATAAFRELYKHFALIEGKTRALDRRSGVDYSKTALSDRYGKPALQAWLARSDKLLVTQAEMTALRRAQAEQAQRQDVELMSAFQRYAYLDGSTSVYDRVLQKILPLAAVKASMGPDRYDFWMNSAEREILPFDNVQFAPGRTLPDGYINTFTGLPSVPTIPPGDLPRDMWDLMDRFPAATPIFQLIVHLCDDRPAVIEWLINWIAYPLQHVGAKLDTAIVMHGEMHGSGKSVFWELIVKAIYGPRYAATFGQENLESQYTGGRSGRLFALFEEVFSSNERYKHSGTIKHMITGRTQTIERKFVDAWEEENHMNAVFLSNAIQPFHVEGHDRRMQVMWVSRKLPPDLKVSVSEAIGGAALAEFYGYLMSVPLLLTMGLDGELLPEPVKFDPHTEPLMTPEKARLIRYGLSGWELFHREWTAGDLPVPYVSCLADDLVLAYRWWVSRSGEREMTRNKFVEAMAARVPKARRWWRWAGMADPRQGQVFKVGLEGAGVAETDYLGRGINEFRSALRRLVGDAAVDELG